MISLREDQEPTAGRLRDRKKGATPKSAEATQLPAQEASWLSFPRKGRASAVDPLLSWVIL